MEGAGSRRFVAEGVGMIGWIVPEVRENGRETFGFEGGLLVGEDDAGALVLGGGAGWG